MATQASDTGSKGGRRSMSDELALIAQRAQAFTNASGTAIALSEGSLDEIVCRARSGSSAPDVGTALRVEGSFTGLCIQSGKEMRCDDADTDTRVDSAAIRALGIRSMVVTPIKEDNRVIGVLAAFAPTAHAFTITHVAVLKTMADQISALLQKERRAREEGVPPEAAHPEPPRIAAPLAAPKPVAAAPSLPPPVVIKPVAPAPRAAFPVVSKVEPIKTTLVAEEVTAPVVLPKKEEKRTEHKPELRASLATFDAVAGEEKKSGISLILLGVVAVVVIGAGATFAYLKFRKHTPSSGAVAQNVQTTPNAAGSQPAAPSAGGASTGQPSSPAVAGGATASKLVADSSAADSSKRTDKNPAKSLVPERTTPEKHTQEPATVALSTAPSKIATSASDSSQGQDTAPTLTLGGTSGPGSLSALAKPVVPSKPSMLSQSELEPVQVLKRVAPTYPIIAKQRRISGTVMVEANVDKTGKVTSLVLLSGPPVFRDAAFDAIKQWQFKPAMLNGQPIDQKTQVRMSFTP